MNDKVKEQSIITRLFSVERLAEDGEKTTYKASLSSESPVQDYPWQPPMILRHTSEAVDLSRIGASGLPLLNSHGRYDISNIIGRIKNVRLERKRLIGDLVFSEANPAAVQVRAMVDEGTLTDMSIGAKVQKIKRIERDGDTESIEALRWTPFEASVVTVGGDNSVGIGRSNKEAVTAEETEMSDAENVAVDGKAAEKENKEEQVVTRIEAGRQEVDQTKTLEMEKRRQKFARDMADANGFGDDIAEEWIQRGYTYDQMGDNILSLHKSRAETSRKSVSMIGLTDKETQQYSICRAIIAAKTGSWKDTAPFELECSTEISRKTNKLPNAGVFYVPLEVQRRSMETNVSKVIERHGLGYLQRDLNVATPGAGGFLTQTTNVSFDELLRNISFAFRMGVTRLSGLRDNVAIPRQSAAATAEWLTSETDAATESQQTFVQLLLSPKTISAYTELSRQLLLQSTMDVEGLVNADLAAVAALGVDAAVLNGSGASGQPEGLDNTTGVGAVTGTSLGFAGVLNFQEDVAGANVMPVRGGYVTTPAVASLMIQRVKYTDTASPLWDGSIWSGTMQGFPAMSTNQVAAATMYFGDWSKAVVAEWGVLEVDTNPFANFPAGIIGVRVMYSVDVGIRYPAAFSKADTIT